MFSKILLLILSIYLVLMTIPVSSQQYPVIINTYVSNIVFKDLHVKTSSGDIILNGVVYGVLETKYVFRHEEVVVLTRYNRYSLTGFKNNTAREYIEQILSGTAHYRYEREEPPYSDRKIFIIEGGIKYYVSPVYLVSTNTIEQHAIFSLGNNTYIDENRVFKYDRGSGVLISLNISSKIKINETIYTQYSIILRLKSSSREELLYSMFENHQLLIITILTYIFITILPCKKSIENLKTFFK